MASQQLFTVLIILLVITTTAMVVLLITKEQPYNPSPAEGTRHNVIVAIDTESKGVSADLYTEVRPGRGLVLVNINDVLADLDTQIGARTAAKVAGEYAFVNMSQYDVIFTIKTAADLIGGQSASSTMAAAVIASLLNVSMRQDVILTGPITDEGYVTEAGGIVEKARAAKEAHASIFLVPPKGNQQVVAYERQKSCTSQQTTTYCVVSTTEKTANISSLVNMTLIEVENIAEAMRYFAWSS